MSKETGLGKYVSVKRLGVSNKVTLAITGDIGHDFDGGALISYLRTWHDKEEEIELDLFSFGGRVFHALAVYDFIKTVGYTVSCNIYGMCGSAATVLACACNSVNIGANSFFFVHGPYYEEDGSTDSQTNKIKDRLISIYQAKTGLDKRTINKLLDEGDKGAILGAKEAKDLGFVDNILKEARNAVAAFIDRAGILAPKKSNKIMDLTGFVNRLLGTDAKDEKEARAIVNQKMEEAQATEETETQAQTGQVEESQTTEEAAGTTTVAAEEGAPEAAAVTEAQTETAAAPVLEEVTVEANYSAAFNAVEAKLNQLNRQLETLVSVVAELAKESAEAAQQTAEASQAQNHFNSQVDAIRQNIQNLHAFRGQGNVAQPSAPVAQVTQAEAQSTGATGQVINSQASKQFLSNYLAKKAQSNN